MTVTDWHRHKTSTDSNVWSEGRPAVLRRALVWRERRAEADSESANRVTSLDPWSIMGLWWRCIASSRHWHRHPSSEEGAGKRGLNYGSNTNENCALANHWTIDWLPGSVGADKTQWIGQSAAAKDWGRGGGGEDWGVEGSTGTGFRASGEEEKKGRGVNPHWRYDHLGLRVTNLLTPTPITFWPQPPTPNLKNKIKKSPCGLSTLLSFYAESFHWEEIRSMVCLCYWQSFSSSLHYFCFISPTVSVVAWFSSSKAAQLFYFTRYFPSLMRLWWTE